MNLMYLTSLGRDSTLQLPNLLLMHIYIIHNDLSPKEYLEHHLYVHQALKRQIQDLHLSALSVLNKIPQVLYHVPCLLYENMQADKSNLTSLVPRLLHSHTRKK